MQQTNFIPSSEQSPTSADVPTNSNSSEPTAEPTEIYSLIHGTPFHVKGNERDGFEAVMGNYVATLKFKTVDELIEYIESKPWELFITLVNVVLNIRNQILLDATKTKTQTENSEILNNVNG